MATNRGLGPQARSDTKARRRIRLHQSWYKERVLGVPYGTGPNAKSTTKYGNMLTEESANAGLNFLTPAIFDLARRRIRRGGGVEPFRLLRNMLSSQPMCFNLFGELALDLGLATRLSRALWGCGIAQVKRVCLEWAPEPVAEYLNDHTAFDAFIEYRTANGRRGFVGIETKLTEPFSPNRYNRYEYRRWMKDEDSPWRPEASNCDADKAAYNQLWRDHLLAWSMLWHRDRDYDEGRLCVIYHPEDYPCKRTIQDYHHLLRSNTTFMSVDLGEVCECWQPLAGPWLKDFKRRYLALDQSEGAT